MRGEYSKAVCYGKQNLMVFNKNLAACYNISKLEMLGCLKDRAIFPIQCESPKDSSRLTSHGVPVANGDQVFQQMHNRPCLIAMQGVENILRRASRHHQAVRAQTGEVL